MLNHSFENASAVVTGGAQGMGYLIAQRLAEAGAHVCIWDIDRPRLDAAAAELAKSGRVHHIPVDIRNDALVAAAAAETAKTIGGPDILVHAAAIAGPTVPAVDYPADAWADVIDVDLNGTFHVNRNILRYMIPREYGRIVNIASIAGKEGNPNASAYSSAKAGVIALTKSLGKEVSHLDIAVNCITPAVAKTRMLEQVSQSHIEYMISKIPRGRLVTLEEIASMVLWMVSPENSFTTGAVFDLSGGRATY